MRGGMTDLRKIATLADTWGITIAPHLFPELNVQLLASIPNGAATPSRATRWSARWCRRTSRWPRRTGPRCGGPTRKSQAIAWLFSCPRTPVRVGGGAVAECSGAQIRGFLYRRRRSPAGAGGSGGVAQPGPTERGCAAGAPRRTGVVATETRNRDADADAERERGLEALGTEIHLAAHAQPRCELERGPVVLAAAHLDHDPTNNRLRNLRSLCQRCHMLHDRTYHLAQRRITYRLRRALGDLFLGPYVRSVSRSST